MPQASQSSDFLPLRRLVVGRLVAVSALSLAAWPFDPGAALGIFLGGLAVAVPEALQYAAARAWVSRPLPARTAVFRACAIHLQKAALTVALAFALLLLLRDAGFGAPWVLAGMAAALAGHAALLAAGRWA